MKWKERYNIHTALIADGLIHISVEWANDGYKITLLAYATRTLKTKTCSLLYAKELAVRSAKIILENALKEVG